MLAPSLDEVQAFFYRLFCQHGHRRKLLLKWQDKVSDYDAFLRAVLYEKLIFKLSSSHFCLFGDALPIRYEWLTPEDRDFVVRLFAARQTLFKVRKEYENAHFEYSGFLYVESDIVTRAWRRQIARDFVWFIWHRRHVGAIVDLVGAIQNLLCGPGSRDMFLANLHGAIQGRCNIDEVLCWEGWEEPHNKVNV